MKPIILLPGSPVGAGAFACTGSPPMTSSSLELEQRRWRRRKWTGNG